MIVDQMIGSKTQVQSLFGLDHMIAPKTLAGQLESFLLSCKVDELSRATLRDYRQKVGAFVSFSTQLGIYEPATVSATHVRLFLLSKQESCLAITIADYYRCAKRFFNWMVVEGILECNPMDPIRPPRIPQKIVQPFTPEQIRTLLLLCDDKRFLGARNKAAVLMFLDTGLRLKELAGIQLRDVDFDREIIKVMGKGSKERIVRIGKRTQKALLRYLLMRNDVHGCLWVSEERRPLTSYGISEALKKLRKRAEFQGVRCSAHTFRHTFATEWLRNGGGEFTLQSALGHSTLDMTRRYAATVRSEQAAIEHRKFSPVDNMELN